jgi:glycosyltransferase involved in cell wall biosynthesis
MPLEGYDILITGTFYSANWLIPHLQPLAMSKQCTRLRMVATDPVPDLPKVEAVYPPNWMIRLIGRVPSRLLLFSWLALSEKPHIIAGFHLLLNGLCAILLSRLIGARSLYICGGGPREVLGGGYQTENRIFSLLKKADNIIEGQHLRAVQYCDLIIVMGSSAATFFYEHGIMKPIHIQPGGFTSRRFYPSEIPPIADIITIGRLSSVKRIDILLETIHLLKEDFPHIKAIIVGGGPLKETLEKQSVSLGLTNHVRFVGQQDNVEDWLRQARIFVMTSDSEGVSQAMIQAMLCGLPAVVSDVGDLADVVKDGENGFLVDKRNSKNFADKIQILLSRPEKLNKFQKAARHTASQYETTTAAQKWNQILQEDK